MTDWHSLSTAAGWLLVLTIGCNNDRTSRTVTPPDTTQQQLAQSVAGECATPKLDWIWCDDFEQDRLSRYFEYKQRNGSFVRAAGVGHNGSTGMRAHFAVEQTDAGALHLAFGKTPQQYFRPVDAGTANYREIYWRLYLRNQPGWTGGGGDKLSRAISFGSRSSWAPAMIAHLWSGGPSSAQYLIIDPASGTDARGTLLTTSYNDFDNLRWLGSARSNLAVFGVTQVGKWHCIEAHVMLNDLGQVNGVFDLWIDGVLEAQRKGLNWVGSFGEYGINAVFIENYWNTGSPVAQERYIDNFVVSKARIGCVNT